MPLPIAPVRAVASRTATKAQVASRASSAGAAADAKAKEAARDMAHHGRVATPSALAADTKAMASDQAADAGVCAILGGAETPTFLPLHYP